MSLKYSAVTVEVALKVDLRFCYHAGACGGESFVVGRLFPKSLIRIRLGVLRAATSQSSYCSRRQTRRSRPCESVRQLHWHVSAGATVTGSSGGPPACSAAAESWGRSLLSEFNVNSALLTAYTPSIMCSVTLTTTHARRCQSIFRKLLTLRQLCAGCPPWLLPSQFRRVQRRRSLRSTPTYLLIGLNAAT